MILTAAYCGFRGTRASRGVDLLFIFMFHVSLVPRRLVLKARRHGRRRPRGHARGHPLAKVVRAPLGLLRGRVVHHHVLKDDILHGHRAVGQNHARVALGRVYRDIAQRHVDVLALMVGSVALGARDLRPAQRARDIYTD